MGVQQISHVKIKNKNGGIDEAVFYGTTLLSSDNGRGGESSEIEIIIFALKQIHDQEEHVFTSEAPTAWDWGWAEIRDCLIQSGHIPWDNKDEKIKPIGKYLDRDLSSELESAPESIRLKFARWEQDDDGVGAADEELRKYLLASGYTFEFGLDGYPWMLTKSEPAPF